MLFSSPSSPEFYVKYSDAKTLEQVANSNKKNNIFRLILSKFSNINSRLGAWTW